MPVHKFLLPNRLRPLSTAIRAGSERFFTARPKTVVFPKDLSDDEREANRRIAFTGAHNFRDLGGYRTDDGSAVKWGVLYRADNLSRMTNHDLKCLSALEISRLIDFRADFERATAPNRLPAKQDFRVVQLPIFDAQSRLGSKLRRRILYGNAEDIDPFALLSDAYVQFVTAFTPQFRTFVHETMAAQGKPVIFHCTAGKDRTGFAAATLLRILGVPWDIIIQDYLLSRSYVLQAYAWEISVLGLIRGEQIACVVEKFLETDTSFLQAAFNEIDLRYGSFDVYVREGLELSYENVAALRLALLEK